ETMAKAPLLLGRCTNEKEPPCDEDRSQDGKKHEPLEDAFQRAVARKHQRVAREPHRGQKREPGRSRHYPAQVHEPLLRMMATRRFLARFEALSFGTSGSESAKPSARSRAGSFMSAAIRPTTDRARSVESSQFDGKRAVRIGWSSVCPVTSTAPGTLSSASATRWITGCTLASGRVLPGPN